MQPSDEFKVNKLMEFLETQRENFCKFCEILFMKMFSKTYRNVSETKKFLKKFQDNKETLIKILVNFEVNVWYTSKCSKHCQKS